MLIRTAQKKDAAQIVPLFKIILHEMELPALKIIPEKKLDQLIQYAFESDDLRFNIGKTLVAEIDGKVAGFAFGYSDELEEKVNNVWQKAVSLSDLPESTELFSDDETLPNEWYLDSIAVSPAFQGKGVGTKLLDSLPEVASKSGNTCIGLSVDFANPLAEKLYRRVGYQKVATTVISQHQYHHMQLKI